MMQENTTVGEIMADELNTNGSDAAEAAPVIETPADSAAVLAALEAAAQTAQDEAADYKDRWLRATAEAQNMRRRFERERADLILSANERLLLRILPVLDDVALAFAHIPADLNEQDQQWVNGFALIQRKLSHILSSEGVTVIETDGQGFDPALHEAITHEAVEGYQTNQIIGEVRKGYKLGERILQPALVRVAQ
ncbi:MAG: nucleotide exchange factor GrpE [Anaerolineae bacterium]|jgi:molecular chaperone GrpE|uniref:nucleotide exchange factor GrpE n=2 Tax=Candidatus Amarolinea dominans TaxID=3140696 RepID=UPI0031CCAD08